MAQLARASTCALALAAALPGAAVPSPPAPAAPVIVLPASAPPGCLPGGNGYLRARIRGALNLDIDWRNAQIECDGGPRPDGSGIRVSFAGPKRADGKRLRMVFGVGAALEGRNGRELPTNLTVIAEGSKRVYTTGGQRHCTVDTLRQQRLPDPTRKPRLYRIVARGFCVAPASTLNQAEHIL